MTLGVTNMNNFKPYIEFASCTINDGYNGHKTDVKLGFMGKRILIVHNSGYFLEPYFCGDIQDLTEAKWLVKNHPNFKRYLKNLTIKEI